MLIVKQNRSEIVNLNCMEEVFVAERDHNLADDGYGVYARGASGKGVTLGEYKDEERAESVLREIVKEYQTPAYKVDTMNFIIRAESAVVYEMPEE